MESGVLEKHVAKLKEEVGVLAVSIKNREFDLENLQATTRQNDVVTDDAPFEEVLKIVEDIKTDISRKETYLEEAHQELDAVSSNFRFVLFSALETFCGAHKNCCSFFLQERC